MEVFSEDSSNRPIGAAEVDGVDLSARESPLAGRDDSMQVAKSHDLADGKAKIASS